MEGPKRSIHRSLRQVACIACMLLIVALMTPIMVSALIWYGGSAGYWPTGGWTPTGMTYNSMAGMTNYWGMASPVSSGAGGWGRQISGYRGAISPSWGTGTGFPAYPSMGGMHYGFTGQYGTGTQAQWMNMPAFPQQGWSSYAGYPAGEWQQPIVDILSGWMDLDNLYSSV